MSTRLALFDIDGTLVTGAATERRFALQLARTGHLGPRQGLAFARQALAGLPAWGRHTLKKDKAWLAGLDVAQLAALARPWAAALVARAGFAPCIARLEHHRQAGDTVALLSGTPQFLAEVIGRELGVDLVVATLCVARDGRFGAAAPLRHPFGAEKLELAHALARATGIGLWRCVAYADSGQDLPLLRAVGTAVAGRPRAAPPRGALGTRGAPACSAERSRRAAKADRVGAQAQGDRA